MVDYQSGTEMADALSCAIAGQAPRFALVERPRAKDKRITWQETTLQTLSLNREALSQEPESGGG